jgi:hypothetical protein
VVYISDDEIAQLPEEPELKFVALERIVRERYEKAWNQLDHQNESGMSLMRRYMSNVLPAAKLYGVKELAGWKRPSSGEESYDLYNAFFADVDYCTTELRLRSVERVKKNSVALDAATKVKLRHLLGQVRETIDQLEVEADKRDRLYARVADLESEINRDRTRLDAVGALFVDACGYAGEGVKKLEPLIQGIERIGAAIGIAKAREDAQLRLPAPKAPKQIEPPRDDIGPARRAPRSEINLDDEIPF